MARVDKKTTILGVLLIDVMAVAIVCLSMVVSKRCGVPLYVVEPMRWIVYASLLIVKPYKMCRWNTIALAIVLPVLSYLMAGHPVLVKNLLISAELCLNVLLLLLLLKRNAKPFLASVVAIVVGKVVYYLLKYVMVTTDALQMNLISTELWIQCVVAVVLSYLFAFFYKRQQ